MDPNANPTPSNTPTDQSPAPVAPEDKGGAPSSPNQDVVAMAKELGEAKARVASLEDYQQKVDPVLQTIYSDQKVYDTVLQTHNKRLGIAVPESTDDGENPTAPQVPPAPSQTEIDNRVAHIQRTLKEFYEETGVNRMEEETKKAFIAKDGPLMKELRDILDPMGNKNDAEIFQTVSVTKLRDFLDKAYFLATKNDQLKAAEERGRAGLNSESVGILGSFSASSVEPENVSLTPKEREIIQKAGWDETKYLERKKKLLAASAST